MSTPAAEKPTPPKREDWTQRDVIPIRFVTFDSTKVISIPGKMITSSVTSDPERPKNKHHHYIVYLPGIRQFIVSFFPANGQSVEVRMIHESHVLCAEPLL